MDSSKKDFFKSSKATFERLNEENYTQWAASMKRLLKAEGLRQIVTGLEKCPVDPATPASTGTNLTASGAESAILSFQK